MHKYIEYFDKVDGYLFYYKHFVLLVFASLKMNAMFARKH